MPLLSLLGVALVTGLAMGFIFERSQFCMSLTFNEAFVFRNYRRLQGVLVLLFVSTVLFNVVLRLGALSKFNLLPGIGIDGEKMFRMVPCIPAMNLVGGVIFGFGMILAGGCTAGTLFRIGEGYVASMMTFIGIFVGGLGLALAVLVGFAGSQVAQMGERLEHLGHTVEPLGLTGVLTPDIAQLLREPPSGQTLAEMLAVNPMLIALLFSAFYLVAYFLLAMSGRAK